VGWCNLMILLVWQRRWLSAKFEAKLVGGLVILETVMFLIF